MTNQELFLKYKADPSIELRNQIVEENLYMVDILIRKYLGKGVEYDDLYQVGALALVSAVERFDPDKGYEFRSFATPTILGEIKKYFRDKQWTLRVPRRLKETSIKVLDIKDELTSRLGRAPTLEEISEETGFTHEQILEAIEGSKAYGTYSLEASANSSDDEDGNQLEKYVGFEESGYEDIENCELINTVLDDLSENYKIIFRDRFILNKSQAEIAKKLGVSQMTVSRGEKAIVKRFRKEFNL